jgi:hypothetical protein
MFSQLSLGVSSHWNLLLQILAWIRLWSYEIMSKFLFWIHLKHINKYNGQFKNLNFKIYTCLKAPNWTFFQANQCKCHCLIMSIMNLNPTTHFFHPNHSNWKQNHINTRWILILQVHLNYYTWAYSQLGYHFLDKDFI